MRRRYGVSTYTSLRVLTDTLGLRLTWIEERNRDRTQAPATDAPDTLGSLRNGRLVWFTTLCCNLS